MNTTGSPIPLLYNEPTQKRSVNMSTTTVMTLIKMMELLPDTAQEQVVEHLREYIMTLQDEHQWDATFKQTQPQLIAAARRAKQEIAAGLAVPLDHDRL